MRFRKSVAFALERLTVSTGTATALEGSGAIATDPRRIRLWFSGIPAAAATGAAASPTFASAATTASAR